MRQVETRRKWWGQAGHNRIHTDRRCTVASNASSEAYGQRTPTSIDVRPEPLRVDHRLSKGHSTIYPIRRYAPKNDVNPYSASIIVFLGGFFLAGHEHSHCQLGRRLHRILYQLVPRPRVPAQLSRFPRARAACSSPSSPSSSPLSALASGALPAFSSTSLPTRRAPNAMPCTNSARLSSAMLPTPAPDSGPLPASAGHGAASTPRPFPRPRRCWASPSCASPAGPSPRASHRLSRRQARCCWQIPHADN